MRTGPQSMRHRSLPRRHPQAQPAGVLLETGTQDLPGLHRLLVGSQQSGGAGDQVAQSTAAHLGPAVAARTCS
eukprot:12205874-Alexandrium_andersonii.AAC.1